MILLFFSFICALIWWLADTNFKGSDVKGTLIPGFKVALLIFAFVLTLVDVYMFVEMNRLVQTSASSINGSCITYTGALMAYPSTITAGAGTVSSGNKDSLAFQNDGNILDMIEDPGNPGINLTVLFTGVTNFSNLHFVGMTDEPTANFHVDLQKPDGSWATIYAFSNSSGMTSNMMTVNGTTYTNGSVVTARILSQQIGNVSSRFKLDWFVLSGTSSYTAYCPTDNDTMNIFIFHNMENSIMLLLLNLLPYLGMLIFALIAIQTVSLLYTYATNRGKGGSSQ